MPSPSTMALRTVARVATALGIRVSSDLLDQWRGWFAPHLQPFSTTRLGVDAEGIGRPEAPTLDIRDTFHVYSDDGWTWLEEAEFVALSLRNRRALLHGRAATGRLRDLPDAARAIAEDHRIDSRIVWWPSVLRRVGDRPLVDYVENKLPPSRHREVTFATWARADRLLPRAVELAGTFPQRLGPTASATSWRPPVSSRRPRGAAANPSKSGSTPTPDRYAAPRTIIYLVSSSCGATTRVWPSTPPSPSETDTCSTSHHRAGSARAWCGPCRRPSPHLDIQE